MSSSEYYGTYINNWYGNGLIHKTNTKKINNLKVLKYVATKVIIETAIQLEQYYNSMVAA